MVSETPRDPAWRDDDAAHDQPAAPELPAHEQAGHPQPIERDHAAHKQPAAHEEAEEPAGRQRGRRRLVVAGVGVGAAVLVAAICAGSLAVVSAIDGFSESSRDARASRQVRDTACLELEGRLNRVAPPGSTANPAGRAGAIRNENAALRLYLSTAEQHDPRYSEDDRERDDRYDDREGPDQRGAGSTVDGWRALLDARTSYAEALDRSAQTRTPAFFVAPRLGAGMAVADQLARWSPETCAGSIRRLAAPDL